VWDVDGVGGGGANAVKMGNKSGTNSGVGKVSFHHAELALGAIFPFIKLNSLALYCLEFALMRLIPENVSDNTGILEINCYDPESLPQFSAIFHHLFCALGHSSLTRSLTRCLDRHQIT